MWMWREKQNNPHYKRLILIIEHNPRASLEKVTGLGVVILVLMGIFGLMSLNYVPLYFLFLFMLFIFTMLTSAIAAWFVANDCGGIEYELVHLTVLSARKLASGYWHGFLKRLIWQMRWLPLTFSFIIFMLNLYFLYFKFTEQPAFVRDYYWEEAIIEMSIGWLVSLTILGGYWIYPLVGISIGLSLKRPMLSSVVTLGIIPIIVGIWFYALIFVYFLPAILITMFELAVLGRLIMIGTMLSLVSLLLAIVLLIMGEMAHGFAKENI